MDNKVLEIVRKNFDVEADVNEFITDIENAKEFTAEKVHLQMLLAEVCKNEAASDSARRTAARALIRTSDLGDAIKMVPGVEDLVQEFVGSLAQNVRIRR